MYDSQTPRTFFGQRRHQGAESLNVISHRSGHLQSPQDETEMPTTLKAQKSIAPKWWWGGGGPEELERKDDGPIWSLAKFVKKLQVAVMTPKRLAPFLARDTTKVLKV